MSPYKARLCLRSLYMSTDLMYNKDAICDINVMDNIIPIVLS